MAYAGDLKSILAILQRSAPKRSTAKIANIYAAPVRLRRAAPRSGTQLSEKPTDTATDTRTDTERLSTDGQGIAGNRGMPFFPQTTASGI